MADEQQDTLTEGEFTDLVQKLKSLGDQLTPKEGRFLSSALSSGIKKREGGADVQGYTMGSALYYPGAYTEDLATTDYGGSVATEVGVSVVGHFNTP